MSSSSKEGVMELHWTAEQEELFARIQAEEGLSRIESIRVYKWRARSGTYVPPSPALLEAIRKSGTTTLSDSTGQLTIF